MYLILVFLVYYVVVVGVGWRFGWEVICVVCDCGVGGVGFGSNGFCGFGFDVRCGYCGCGGLDDGYCGCGLWWGVGGDCSFVFCLWLGLLGC